MHVIDWAIVGVVLGFMLFCAMGTRKYTKSVADFLAANRCAGRYLLTVSEGMASLGAITLIAGFEIYYKTGFTAAWWAFLLVAVRTLVMLSGWVVYRYRQTRALTMAQFLEMRYSRKFRIFAGIIAWLAGIVNFGVFPAVGARFIIYFCGLPYNNAVYATILAVLILVALFFTYLGGQIAVIVTDFIQGSFTNIMFVLIMVALLVIFGWDRITDTLVNLSPDSSMIDPFKTQNAKDFNIWFFLIQAWGFVYAMGVWQGNQGYNASALSAHEARMGKILSTWRIMAVDLFVMFVPICAYVFYNHPDFAQKAQGTLSILAGIENPQISKQMTTVVAAKAFLPVGLAGGFVALMLAAFISTHDTYLHSWGSIFIQDVVMPFRNKPLSQKTHMKLLRFSILGVAVFIFLFSFLFRQTEYISMFFMITGAIFIGGAGAVVIGGLYWKKGTTLAAWLAMITGSALSVGVIILKQIAERVEIKSDALRFIADQNGAILSFYASLIAIAVYIVVSLFGRQKAYDMDKLLHRGKYRKAEDAQNGQSVSQSWLMKAFGITDEFTFKDKVVYFSTTAWTGLIVLVFVVGMLAKLVWGVDISTHQWVSFWKCYFYIVFGLSVLTTVWFTFGGLRDLKKMFRLLGTLKRDQNDDGGVSENESEIIEVNTTNE